MCEHIHPIDTKTKFIILMHPKEYRKTKNGTGHFTNKSLNNSEIHIGIDFTKNEKINKIVNDEKNECYILYPGKDSIPLNSQKIETKKNIVLFLIDSTWACSKKMIRESKNLKNLKKVSFQSVKESNFRIKEQPAAYCLSTIETTQYILELLNNHSLENLEKKQIEDFTKPFDAMVEYQLDWLANNPSVRYKY